MKTVVSCLLLAFIIGAVSVNAAIEEVNCRTGKIRGFAVFQDPETGMGGMPSRFTPASAWFEIKYNCNGRGVFARRVDLGLYDVWFPGNPGRVAVVSAVSDQGTTASVVHIEDTIFRVSLRGPFQNNNILQRRDIPFNIVIT